MVLFGLFNSININKPQTVITSRRLFVFHEKLLHDNFEHVNQNCFSFFAGNGFMRSENKSGSLVKLIEPIVPEKNFLTFFKDAFGEN